MPVSTRIVPVSVRLRRIMDACSERPKRFQRVWNSLPTTVATILMHAKKFIESDYPLANDVLAEYLRLKDYYLGKKDADWDYENNRMDYQAIVSDLLTVLQDFKSIWTESTTLIAIPEKRKASSKTS
jgi:hypothetical protein